MTTTISIGSYTNAELASLKGLRRMSISAILDGLQKAKAARDLPSAQDCGFLSVHETLSYTLEICSPQNLR